MLDKNAVAERVWEFVWGSEGYRGLSGVDIRVENVRLNSKRKLVVADVVVDNYDAGELIQQFNRSFSYRELRI